MNFFKLKFFILLLTFVATTFNLNAVSVKQFIELTTINDFFSVVENIKKEYEDIIDIDAFENQNTAIVWDIDGTITIEVEAVLNQELVREQRDHAKIIANQLSMTIETFIEDIQYFWRNTYHEIQLVEKNTNVLINDIQERGYTTFTCTSSSFVKNDQRLKLMQEEGIDFSKNFMGVFSDVYFDFFSQDPQYKGHTSARNSTKAKTIDHLIHQINEIREIKKLPIIKNLIFIDNYKNEAENVLKNCQEIKNIIAFHYTYVKNHTSLDEVIAGYNRYVNQFDVSEEDAEEEITNDFFVGQDKISRNFEELFQARGQNLLSLFSLDEIDYFNCLLQKTNNEHNANLINNYVILTCYDAQTTETYCLLKKDLNEKSNMLVFEPYLTFKDLPKHEWLSDYLEKQGLGKFNLKHQDLLSCYNYFDKHSSTNIYFLNGLKININEIEENKYIKAPLIDFIFCIESRSLLKINGINYNICPFFLDIAFSLIDEISYLKYNR